MPLIVNKLEFGEFFLKDIFSDIQRGKRLTKENQLDGLKPYASSTIFNNGIDNFISNNHNVRCFSNCLTIANSGSVGASFYHPYEFIASDHITHLKNNNMNKFIYLFIGTLTSRLSEKYNFSREINDKRISKEKILLPKTQNGEVSFGLMEQYTKDIIHKKTDTYKYYAMKRLLDLNYKNISSLDDVNWDGFEIGKLFKLQTGKSKGLNHLEKTTDGINYLGATNRNNGVLCQVKQEDKMAQNGNCIAFIRNGEGSMGYAVYKAESFIATSDITVGYADFLNRYIGLFITTVSDKIRGKYNFGYKRSDTRLKKEKILLPINAEGKPDWEYMEQYIKNLEYKKIKQYLDFLDRQNINYYSL